MSSQHSHSLGHLGTGLEMTVLLSTAAAIATGLWVLRSKPEPAAGAVSRPLVRWVTHPLSQLLAVCALLYANQVLFGAYILRAHGGSTAFIAQYIPGPWFAIGQHDPLVRYAAHHVGDGQWLSPTLLRVQAFLELPFTMFAYLAVARLLGTRVYMTLCRPRLLALAALSFSVTFSIIELALPNPYTHDDIVLRAAACVVFPVYVAWISRRSALTTDGPTDVLGLLAFLVGAGSISYLVLAAYDALLLYNLAHLPRYANGSIVAVVLAAGASIAGPRIDAALARATGGRLPPSPAMEMCVSTLGAFTVLFFVPSLSLRYWGGHSSAFCCGLLLVGLALVAGTTRMFRRARSTAGGILRLLFAAGVAFFAAIWAAEAALRATAVGALPELVLARAALSFLAVAIVVFRAVEIAVCWPEHETKAEADEA